MGDRIVHKDLPGQAGRAMREVWGLNSDIKFDDGLEEIEHEPGAKPPPHSDYYTALLEKHSKTICIDCGQQFVPDKPKTTKTGRKIPIRFCGGCKVKNRNEKRLSVKQETRHAKKELN